MHNFRIIVSGFAIPLAIPAVGLLSLRDIRSYVHASDPMLGRFRFAALRPRCKNPVVGYLVPVSDD
jgi:hypothetical protein